MLIKDKFHLTYCTNIHPGRDWAETLASLQEYVPGIKQQVSKDSPMGLGLRLSNTASEEMNVGDRLHKFKQWLEEEGIYVFTMNGFPFGNFHNERVKDHVHTPDWSTDDRLRYTIRLFDQLAVLIPDGIHGGISTSPISYKHWYPKGKPTEDVLRKGAAQLAEVVIHLQKLEQRTGKYLHLDIEPEPDGLLENTEDVLQFFSNYLLPVATDILESRLGTEADEARELILKYICICYDICHFSLAYEEPSETFSRFRKAGIRIGKIQVSAALKILSKAGPAAAIWNALSVFDEPTYLHQVTERVGGTVVTYPDLPVVLKSKKPFRELRAHFHVPVFLEKFGLLYATQDQILKVIDILRTETISEHLEIETYTWEVLPVSLKSDLGDSIVREIQWLTSKL